MGRKESAWSLSGRMHLYTSRFCRTGYARADPITAFINAQCGAYVVGFRFIQKQLNLHREQTIVSMLDRII
jgi:hypothetical protein